MDTVARTGGRFVLDTTAWATRLTDVRDVGLVLLGPDATIALASEKARSLLQVRTDDELAARWASLGDTIRPALERASVDDQRTVDTTVHTVVAGTALHLHVEIHAVEGDDCVGYLLLVQPADRAEAVEASLRHAAHHRGLTSLYRDMAHDLKSVLNVIGLNLALLARVSVREPGATAETERAQRCVEVMRREITRLDRSIDLILDRAMRDRDRPERFDVAGCCERVAQLVAARAARQRVDVRMRMPGEPLFIDGFPDRIQGAILNLVVNALDAMPDGGTLDIDAWRDSATCAVRVSDTGPGIADEALPHLGTLHYTTKPHGTGIGLHVAKATAASHEGRLSHERRGQGGAAFTLELPASVTS